jgi:hypothetical protein
MMTISQLREVAARLGINCLSVANFHTLIAHTKAEHVSKKAIETEGQTLDFLPAILYSDNGISGHVGIAIGGANKFRTCYDNDALYNALISLNSIEAAPKKQLTDKPIVIVMKTKESIKKKSAKPIKAEAKIIPLQKRINGLMSRIRSIIRRYVPGNPIYTNLAVSDAEQDSAYIVALFRLQYQRVIMDPVPHTQN